MLELVIHPARDHFCTVCLVISAHLINFHFCKIIIFILNTDKKMRLGNFYLVLCIWEIHSEVFRGKRESACSLLLNVSGKVKCGKILTF